MVGVFIVGVVDLYLAVVLLPVYALMPMQTQEDLGVGSVRFAIYMDCSLNGLSGVVETLAEGEVDVNAWVFVLR